MTNLSKLKILNNLLVFLGISCFSSYSQTIEEFQALKNKYNSNSVLFLKNYEKVTIDLENGKPAVKVNFQDEFVILEEKAVNGFATEEVSFSSFEEIEKINAYAMVPNEKGKYKRIDATNFTTKDAEQEGSVFHDDEKVTSFIYPGLKEGAYRVLDYTEKRKEARFPFGFSFNSSLPLQSSTFIIDCDTSIHIKFQVYEDKGKKVNYKEEIVKGRKIMTWSIVDPVKLKTDERSPSSRYYSPHIIAQIAYYNYKNVRTNVVSSPADLHKWYRTNIVDVINEVPSDELKQITDSIVKNVSSEVDKVKAVYYWVQNNIKYIAFEDGINGFVPRQPNAIIAKRYGDCKDMASLLFAMLKHLNIKSYLTWIGTRDLPYKYSEFPSSVCDNHMITTYYHDNKPYFLDATASFLTFGYPSHGIIGKEAFLSISENEYRIEQVPTLPIGNAVYCDSSFISFDGNKIIGKGHSTLGGYYNVMLNEAYKNVAPDKLKELVENINERGNNSFKVNSAKVENVGERDKSLNVYFDFEINNYVTSYENETYINLILDKGVTCGEMKADRIAPLYMDNHSSNQYIVTLDIPENYTLKYTPKDAEFKCEYFDYSLKYKKIGDNKIQMTLVFDIKFILLYPENFKTWNDFIKVLKSSINETIVLQKK